MCDPAMLATALLAGQAAGAGMSAVGAYGAARSQQSSLRYQAGIADFNARLSEQRAQIAQEQGRAQVYAIQRQAAGIKGEQRQTMAARGLDLTVGTPAELLTQTDFLSQQDQEQAEINAVREAWGFRTQGANYQAEGRTARANADAISPGLAVAGSLLGSATSMASSWYGFKKQGAWG